MDGTADVAEADISKAVNPVGLPWHSRLTTVDVATGITKNWPCFMSCHGLSPWWAYKGCTLCMSVRIGELR